MTGRLRITGLTRSFGETRALDDVDLTLEPGTLTCVVGPSGCGKTTLLRSIAGLERPDRGRITIDERDVTDLPAARRPTAMVFQSDTLFSELTVRDNVAFGLRARGLRGPGPDETVEVALLRLGLSGLAGRYPVELSGGQKRRVALARALVLKPAVLLLDEPGAGLDAPLRSQILGQIRSTQRRFGLTTLVVTHDAEDALSIADRVLLLRAGRVAQLGPPRELYQRPDSLDVARSLGRGNFVEAVVDDVLPDPHRVVVELLGQNVAVPAHPAVGRPGQAVAMLVRPHALLVEPGTSAAARPGRDVVRGSGAIVVEARYLGERLEYTLETEAGSLLVSADPVTDPHDVGAVVRVRLRPELLWALPLG